MYPALVLTAGLATRLRPLSYDRAKAAVPIAGAPLICRILAWLAHGGARDAVLNLHHLPATVTAAVGDGSQLGLRVRYSWEYPLLGSAGGPRKMFSLLESDCCVVVNGDTMTKVDLAAVCDAHAAAGALVTMALVRNPDPARYGGVRVTPDGWVSGFTPPGSQAASYHFIGVQVVAWQALADLPADTAVDSVGEVYPGLIRRDRRAIRAYMSDASFEDVGTPADYLATCLAVGRREGRQTLLPGARCQIAPSATVVRTIIWDDVVVEDSARLFECIVGDAVRIPAGAAFERCAIVRADGRPAGPGASRAGDLLVARLEGRDP